MIDFHCHLDLYPDPHQVVAACRQRDLYVLSVTTTPSAWNGTSALVNKQDRIQTALGLHPQLAHERHSELLLFDANLPKVKYVGEIGLDGTTEFRPHWEMQIKVFEHILRSCIKEGGRIMSIHSRSASHAVLEKLEAFKGAGVPVLHWFSGNLRDLERAKVLDCWFSVGPAMLSGERGRVLIAKMPQNRILTESDGPFAKTEGRFLYPWDMDIALRKLSSIWDLSYEETEHIIGENFQLLASAA